MKSYRFRFARVLLLGSFLLHAGCATLRPAHPRAADPADVGTIDGIMRASYEVINGPPGVPRQWERDRTLYLPGAIFVANWYENGTLIRKILTPEQYRRGFRIGNGVYESEIGRRVERFGNVAEVRSVTAFRERQDGAVHSRYVNYYQLSWDGARWWVAGAVWDTERPGAPIPEDWVGRWEELSR
jgi:hypothetical protein